jgi:hypothetical protein
MMRAGTKQSSRFHLPLVEGDEAAQTVGCRHTNPDICAKHSMPTVCAFARLDDMCLAPPLSWAKQFNKLFQLKSRLPEGK